MSNYGYVTGVSTMDQIVVEERMEVSKTTEERMGEYLESIQTIEECMQPFKDQKKDLKSNYVENGWLTKEEISMVTKAYRLVKSNLDELDELLALVNTLRTKVKED